MSMQADLVVRVLEALERERVRYAGFGAVAVNVHGLPRFTEDLDVFVARSARTSRRSSARFAPCSPTRASTRSPRTTFWETIPPSSTFPPRALLRRHPHAAGRGVPFRGPRDAAPAVRGAAGDGSHPPAALPHEEGHGPPQGPHGCRSAPAEVRAPGRLMAIREFRSVEEMDGYHWYEPGDPVLFRAIRRVWELGGRVPAFDRPGGSAAVRVGPCHPEGGSRPPPEGSDGTADLRTPPDPPVVETTSRPLQAGLEGQPPFLLSPDALPPAGRLVWRWQAAAGPRVAALPFGGTAPRGPAALVAPAFRAHPRPTAPSGGARAARVHAVWPRRTRLREALVPGVPDECPLPVFMSRKVLLPVVREEAPDSLGGVAPEGGARARF